MEFLQPKLNAAPAIRPMINVGAGLDVITGYFVIGKNGESILNGGLATLTGATGMGNSFKTTILDYIELSACSRMAGSSMFDYDCEENKYDNRKVHLASRIEEFNGEDIVESGRFRLGVKSEYSGDEYFDAIKEMLNEKKKNKDKDKRRTPFKDRDGNYFYISTPFFTFIDSLSAFSTQDAIRMQDENSLGDSGANTLYMRKGLQKKRLLDEIPALCSSTHSYMLTIAHLGNEFDLGNQRGAPPPKKLQYLQQGLKIKEVPENFTFLTNHCWLMYSATPLKNQTTKAPEYPRNQNDDLQGDTDLVTVTMVLLRNKTGPSGMSTQIIASQADGVLPSLTEFHYIKTHERFGLEGNDRNYQLTLLPDVNLSRTTVRGKIDSDGKLRRALNITSELCQIHDFHHDLDPEFLITPKELYEKIKARGFDWNYILENTRGWWTIDDEDHPLKFLSTMDLIRMTLPEDHPKYYFPYWMNADKTIKQIKVKK